MNGNSLTLCEDMAYGLLGNLDSKETFILCQFLGEIHQPSSFDDLVWRTGNGNTLMAALTLAWMSSYHFSVSKFRSYVMEIILPLKKAAEVADVKPNEI